MARTAIPAPASSLAVPPVETISTPSSARPRANSAIPRLSETDSRARLIWTAPGATASAVAVETEVLSVAAICRGYRQRRSYSPRLRKARCSRGPRVTLRRARIAHRGAGSGVDLLGHCGFSAARGADREQRRHLAAADAA